MKGLIVTNEDSPMTMSPRQITAISFPCARAPDTLRQRFFAMVFRYSTILTVNK